MTFHALHRLALPFRASSFMPAPRRSKINAGILKGLLNCVKRFLQRA